MDRACPFRLLFLSAKVCTVLWPFRLFSVMNPSSGETAPAWQKLSCFQKTKQIVPCPFFSSSPVYVILILFTGFICN